MSTLSQATFSPARLGGRLVAFALVLGSAGAVLAQTPPVPPSQGRLTPAQQQKIFPEQRALLLKDQRARTAILQSGERCVSAATGAEALRTCRKQERRASQNQRQQFWAEMRSLYERNGIPLPERRRGGRGPAAGKSPANTI